MKPIWKSNYNNGKATQRLLVSEIRIVTMRKRELEQRLKPSYVAVDGFGLYVTYCGQHVTRRYCSEVGHVLSDCKKPTNDFPTLKKDQRPSSATLHHSVKQID